MSARTIIESALYPVIKNPDNLDARYVKMFQDIANQRDLSGTFELLVSDKGLVMVDEAGDVVLFLRHEDGEVEHYR
jgi:hypothetical protein